MKAVVLGAPSAVVQRRGAHLGQEEAGGVLGEQLGDFFAAGLDVDEGAVPFRGRELELGVL